MVRITSTILDFYWRPPEWFEVWANKKCRKIQFFVLSSFFKKKKKEVWHINDINIKHLTIYHGTYFFRGRLL